jgi:Protein of unknown function (DUF1553)/Protein of unknown function (DUF1549)/Planctomycete cytochrome C
MNYSAFQRHPRTLVDRNCRSFWPLCVAACASLLIHAAVLASARAADDAAGKAAARPAFPPEAIEFFEARVRPILADKCFKCHGAQKQSNGLRLDSREAALKGGDSGPALVSGKPDESLLVKAVAQTHADLKMPPSGKLPDASVAALRQWVSQGAAWPAIGAGTASPAKTAAPDPSTHWAFRPITPVAPPAVKNRAAVQAPVDAFVIARLEAAGLSISPVASKRALIRRATIDLWGIPPAAEEVDAFEADCSPDAFAHVVDRLLASPRYGERWGRHWLDVARYADTKGYVFTQDRRYPFAYTFRDYVISAFNSDLGYDKFVQQQLAADQLGGSDRRPLAAMGFLTVGRRFLLDQNEIIDDRIDVVSRGFLGLTVTCARCHDHKFDPIPTEDYYSLYGVFASTVEPAELPLLADATANPRFVAYQNKLTAATKTRDDFLAARRGEFSAEMTAKLSQYLKAGQSLNFDARSRKLEEQARAAGLNSRRLRGVMSMWRRHVSGVNPKDPVFGPWRAFAALPSSEFAGKAAELHRELVAPKDPKAAPVHPLVAKVVLASPPSSANEVVDRYASLFAQLETRWKEETAKSKGGPVSSLADPEWESLRKAIFGDGGPLAASNDGMRLILDQGQRNRLEQLNAVIQQINATDPGSPPRAMVVNDSPKPVDPHVFMRGNPGRPGPAIPRRFLKVLSGSDRTPFRHGSGRLELAQAITSAANPLTARVFVNRVWLWHFGKGLVGTASDFGVRSDPPSHPELLDYLAGEFIKSGWSIKDLHRRIMLSTTYQQQSAPRTAELAADADNRLLWRFNRQRLDFESMRDSVLAVAGSLGPYFGGPTAAIDSPAFLTRRTLYGFIDRQNLDGVYRTFDFAVPDATSPRRFVTTVPQQALFLMNSPFLHEQARRLSGEIVRNQGARSAQETAETVRNLYRRVLGRLPEADELALATAFIAEGGGGASAAGQPGSNPGREPQLSPWEQLSQVLLLTNEFMFVD